MAYPPYNEEAGYAPLPPDSDTLVGLSPSHRSGLTAVAFFGTLSFVTSTVLFLFLTVKLIRWRFAPHPSSGPSLEQRRAEEDAKNTNDISLGLTAKNFATKPTQSNPPPAPSTRGPYRRKAPNQFLILVYNLLLADMHQATAFMLNITWLNRNEIAVGTDACWAQGFFVSNGDLAASCFITAIAFHTYFSVVRGYRPPHRVLYAMIGFLWVFVYLMGGLGVAITNNGKEAGGLYVRAAAWCWMNVKYEKYRLWLHYFWIFVSLALTSLLYTLVFLSLRSKKPATSSNNRQGDSRGDSGIDAAAAAMAASGHHPAFLVYPIIYVICTAPLAFGRIATMAGANVSVEYFCLAGSLIASNGWLDVVLFSTTRNSIIFKANVDAEEDGIETFAFMRTPHGRRYGNMVWVQGGLNDDTNRSGNSNGGRGQRKNGSWGWEVLGERMGWRGAVGRSASRNNGRDQWAMSRGNMSQESLRTAGADMPDGGGNGIMLDTVTTVVVEIERNMKEREPSAFSYESTDKDETAQKAQPLRM
ncbi:G protein-coupled glucose receptor regulating Gpa2-domain-containing protein [Microdochium trichocladiopsis]|uniref:G protein-coupled glucose receptor regulating Gpa2-domain-containing protein n=1 Tax=Microdochium trichocladiopsis TaxID=1682393 RepID=A0A9P9BN10_9PEZI|nr:G protein-coupled glucose receptor regulating Gpa2-domain-containing protein [Microdochium trichocladiopsis]KAH7027236.1 G protein-coupled glucose receptor regulating Gpa2-domain-containing protein [Microdochium trichocladiopsis]